MSCTLDNGFGIWLLDQPVSNHERIEAKRCHSDLSPQPALTFMPSSFPLSINSSSLLLSSNWEENTGRVSLPPRPLWTHRGHATRSPRVDLHDIGPQGCPSPPILSSLHIWCGQFATWGSTGPGETQKWPKAEPGCDYILFGPCSVLKNI